MLSKNRTESILKTLLFYLKKNPDDYAIQQSIIFFEATKNFISYIYWILVKAPYIDESRILELGDFSFSIWDQEMYDGLIQVERGKFLGLVNPLVKKIVGYLKNRQEKTVIVTVGSGGMEVERQVLQMLLASGYQHKVLWIGIDRSDIAHAVAEKNLNSLGTSMKVIKTDLLTSENLFGFIDDGQYQVILCKNDFFDIVKFFNTKEFDLVVSSLFKHHLPPDLKIKFDQVTKYIAKNFLEYDGYRNLVNLIPQSLIAWNNPILLNASVFSGLRYQQKNKIKIPNDCKITFYSIGTYLLASSNT